MKKIFWRVWWGLIIVLAALLSLVPADKFKQPEAMQWAQTLKPQYPFCLSEQTFKELTSAQVNQDQNQVAYLFNHGCFSAVPDLKFSVIDTSFGTAKIRLYLPLEGQDSVIVWTNVEAIKP